MSLNPTRVRFTAFTLFTLCLLTVSPFSVSQGALQPGIPVERTIAPGQTHAYSITLKQNQYLRLAVGQHGIDVGIRASTPDGERIGDFDSANGTSGTETVALIAESSGQYRLDVIPLDGFRNPPPGQYEIRILEIRNATDLELKEGKSREMLRAGGLALLSDITESLQEIRNPQTRGGFQLQAARLLWDVDDKRAARLMEQAIESVKQSLATLSGSDTGDSQDFRTTRDLRQQIIASLIPHEPELALAFIRSTRGFSNAGNGFSGPQDWDLELSVANQFAENSPNRTLQIAEDVLKEGLTQALIKTVEQLRFKSPDLAANLAHDILKKLVNERLLATPSSTYMASSFVQLVRPAGRLALTGGNGNAPLISDTEFKSLLQKMVSELLSYSQPDSGIYTAETNAARILALTLKPFDADFQNVEPERAPALMQKLTQIIGTESPALREYSINTNNVSIETGLTSADQAMPGIREMLYEQVANQAAKTGDLERARQIITNNLENPARQQALNSLERQAIYAATSGGKFQEALQLIRNFQLPNERIDMLAQVVSQIGPGLKKATAITFLDQARNMLNPSARAEGQEEMKALLAIGEAFSPLESNRGFEIVEPLVDQFNDLSLAAMSMNGFPEKYYQDGELITNNGNTLAQTAEQLSETLSSLAWQNFQRAKAAADRIHPVSVRIRIYLAIAEKAIHPAN